MKELSIEQKAKAYDKIRDRAKKELGACGSLDCDAARQIFRLFPELAESEDERIRKDIIWCLKHSGIKESNPINPHVTTITKDAIAWLEKQYEKKVSEYDIVKTIKERIIEHFDNHLIIDKCFSIGGLKDDILKIINEVKYAKQGEPTDILDDAVLDSNKDGLIADTIRCKIEKQGEQKSTDKVEPKFKVGQTIKKEGFNLGFTIVKIEDGFYYNNTGDHFPFTDQDSWELVGQEPAWSEEDEKIINGITSYLCTHDSCELDGFDKWYDFLKSLKDRVQPKQEWSEEDKDVLEDIEEAIINYWHGQSQEDLLDWLKSIRPQNRWKPSGFHLECIEDAISLYEKHGINAIGLKEILDELKKLKE